ncbi:MAG: diguanylate cyclase [Chromatiales bacterium]|nr:diguanylate cyclase [Chromatiales bacterium]
MLASKKRFIWLLTTLLAAGFITASLISYWVARESLGEQLSQNTLPLTSDNIYSEIQHDILRPLFIASIMAQDTFVRDWVIAGEHDSEIMTHYLKEIQQRYNTVTSFFVSNNSYNYYHSTGILKRIKKGSKEDKWYFRTLNLPADKDYEINIDTDTADRDSTTVFVNYRMYNYAREVIGVIGVGLAIDMVKSLVDDYQRRFHRNIYFVDRQGKIAIHGNINEEISIYKKPGLSTIAKKIFSRANGSFNYQLNGNTVYLNSRFIPEFQWYLIVEQESNPSDQHILKALFINILLSLLVSTIVFFFIKKMVDKHQQQLEKMATTDKLTGVANRGLFELLLEQSIKNYRRRKSALTIIMLDIDHFKRINDQHGHLVGDQVLRHIAATIAKNVRHSDTVCRWGGEEFILLLPDCDLTQAYDLAEQIRIAIESHQINIHENSIYMTASFGVSEYSETEESIALIRRADQALYQAKSMGRNRVIISKISE